MANPHIIISVTRIPPALVLLRQLFYSYVYSTQSVPIVRDGPKLFICVAMMSTKRMVETVGLCLLGTHTDRYICDYNQALLSCGFNLGENDTRGGHFPSETCMIPHLPTSSQLLHYHS